MRTAIALAVVAGCISTAPTRSAPASRDVAVYASRDDAAMTEGDTTLATDPATAYRVAADYTRWPVIFPGIERAVVTEQRGDDARVTFVHPDGNVDNVHFHNRPTEQTVWFEDTGGHARVWAEIAFIPGDRPGTTRAHSRLFADVQGLAALFVSDAKVRSLREQRVYDDLIHLRGFFAGAVAAR
jgi:hypothetical protein